MLVSYLDGTAFDVLYAKSSVDVQRKSEAYEFLLVTYAFIDRTEDGHDAEKFMKSEMFVILRVYDI